MRFLWEEGWSVPFIGHISPGAGTGDFLQLWSTSAAGMMKNRHSEPESTQWISPTLGKEPVPPRPASGAGCSLRSLFDTLQAEVDKLHFPAISGTSIGRRYAVGCRHSSTRSKDLLVASYLAVGLVQTRQGTAWPLG